MKRLFAMILSVGLIGSTAMAFEGTMHVQPNGDVLLKKVDVVCKVESPAHGDEPEWTVCRPADGVNCGEGYHRMHKYCWKGFKKGGFGRCGYVCEKDRTNGWEPEYGSGS
ncbi:hypothetical protein [Bdellovibrio sp. HCB209]|uniref:hypothetical protein n=1 Tax=Bdellovibrio sp. HCB209 TaxID=3394354 RepID=UPI0039B3DF49